MIDREKVVTVLRKRFPEASAEAIAAAANAIVGLGDEWHEVEAFQTELTRHLTTSECGQPDCIVRRLKDGGRYRLFERTNDRH
ncbi:MAG: hypothetical protein AB7O67_09415 [Vicinamibacterales bacterium]